MLKKKDRSWFWFACLVTAFLTMIKLTNIVNMTWTWAFAPFWIVIVVQIVLYIKKIVIRR